MYNVIIVDDEPVIRFGLKATVNWKEENLHLFGDYRNGEEALRLTEGVRVDILITDIKMPVMGGIELMKKLLERNPLMKVILVSSYTDFEYVKDGLRLGAIDYVLKPTLEQEDFVKLIQKCVYLLDNDQLMKQKLEFANHYVALSERKELERRIKELLLEESPANDVSVPGQWKDRRLMVITMSVLGIDNTEETGYLNKMLVLEDVQECFYEYTNDGICFPIANKNLIAIFRVVMNEKDFLQKLKNNLEDELNIKLVIGYTMIDHLGFVKEGYEYSYKAQQSYFFNSDMDIFEYDGTEYGKLPTLDRELLKNLILPYEKNKLLHYIEKRFEEWVGIHTSDLLKEDAYEILHHSFVKRVNSEELIYYHETFEKAETVEELKELLVEMIEGLTEWIQTNKMIYLDDGFMQKAVKYIHDNYIDNITLKAVAEHIHMSPNYFSVKFKECMGMNFIDYVMDLRIKKSKELLGNTDLKIYEVAYQSGFNDVKYFSKLFKRMVDLSPTEYRTVDHQRNE